ncbi:MAG: Txe/YoeB family addiction module toxin [Oscillospiraceae bacterium]|jgi:toxin YoeB|nr:Txe/YoeB family addiction module toxin [Oscillospiraceae bacterium]
MRIDFTETAWQDYVYWQTQDRKTLKRVNNLIEDITRNGYVGIGNPEPLAGDLSGWWSRRIDSQHRLVYRLADASAAVEISQCRWHYKRK